MSAWTDLGLPLPNANGYGYTRDAALLRSPFDCAMPDQDQRNTNWRKTFNVSWNLSLEQLNLACQYLLSIGFSWFDLELVSNETPIDENISIHQIRLTSNYNIKPLGGIYFQLSANIESRVVPQSCITVICDTITNFDDPICDYITVYPVQVYKSNLYAIANGIATGASVHKAALYSVFNVLGDAVNALKVNLYGVHQGMATGAAANKVNHYAILGGAATGSTASKVNLYAVIDTIEDSSS